MKQQRELAQRSDWVGTWCSQSRQAQSTANVNPALCSQPPPHAGMKTPVKTSNFPKAVILSQLLTTELRRPANRKSVLGVLNTFCTKQEMCPSRSPTGPGRMYPQDWRSPFFSPGPSAKHELLHWHLQWD